MKKKHVSLFCVKASSSNIKQRRLAAEPGMKVMKFAWKLKVMLQTYEKKNHSNRDIRAGTMEAFDFGM